MSHIYDELNALHDELDRESLNLKKLGEDNAVKKAEYYKRKSIEALKLRADKMPVTLIETVIKGLDSVNKAYYDHLSAEALYKATQERVNVLKIRDRDLKAEIEREYYS